MQYFTKDKATNAVDQRKSPQIQVIEPQPLCKKKTAKKQHIFVRHSRLKLAFPDSVTVN